MTIEEQAVEEFNNSVARLDIEGIPPGNKLPEQFFYDYAYPRLFEIVEDPVFVAQYTYQFGHHNPVELTDPQMQVVGTVPGLYVGTVTSSVNVPLLLDAVNDANDRMQGSGDTLAAQVLPGISIHREDEDAWTLIHEQFRKRNCSVTPTNSNVETNLDELMEWD